MFTSSKPKLRDVLGCVKRHLRGPLVACLFAIPNRVTDFSENVADWEAEHLLAMAE
jgi:hypothetical protein